MYFSNFPMALWETTPSWLPAWAWPSRGSRLCVGESPLHGHYIQPSPSALLRFLGPCPLTHWPMPPLRGSEKSLGQGGASVCPLLSLQGVSPPYTPFQGGPMVPEAIWPTLQPLRRTIHTGEPGLQEPPLPQQLPLCALPSCFCTPLSRGPVAGSKNPPTPREKPAEQRSHPKKVGKKET